MGAGEGGDVVDHPEGKAEGIQGEGEKSPEGFAGVGGQEGGDKGGLGVRGHGGWWWCLVIKMLLGRFAVGKSRSRYAYIHML